MDLTQRSIQGVLFDKDGTLFDFKKTWNSWAYKVLQSLADSPGHARTLGDAIGFDIDAQEFSPDSIAIAGSTLEAAQCLLPHVRGYSLNHLVLYLNTQAAHAPQSEAVPLGPFLDDLHARGLKVGVATNDGEVPARAHLASANIADRFDFIAGYDSGFGAKPQPGQLKGFCAHVGLDANVCVMVGDSRHDLAAGRAAGFTTVGVLTGHAFADDLEDLADVVLPSIAELVPWIDAQ